jgi:deoxycytidylate deaminase
MDTAPPFSGTYFKYAREESFKSTFIGCRVGACLVIGKSIIKGHNKRKTHPIFANPNHHTKTSIHAELDCLSKLLDYRNTNGILYVYRETQDGKPGLSRPCEHCLSFLRDSGIKEVFYSVEYYPYYEKEIL